MVDCQSVPVSIPVKADPSIAGSAPVRLPEVKFVKLEPLAAGSVAGNRASGTVPDVKFVALSPVSPLPSSVPVTVIVSPLSPNSH
jgi:hypothetical protein